MTKNYKLTFFTDYLKKADKVTHFLICVVALSVVYDISLLVANSRPNSFSHIKWLTYGRELHDDSWGAMTEALNHIKRAPEEPVYQSLLIDEGIKFQYPPSSLLLLDLARWMSLDYKTTVAILDIVSLIGIFLIAFFCSKILTVTLSRYNFQALGIPPVSNPAVVHFLILALTLMFYPLLWSYHIGQIQTLKTLFATMAIYYWLTDKKSVSGFLLGLICLVKPQLGLVFLWAIIRRQWRMVITGAITIASVLLVSITLYGIHHHVDYLSALSFLSRHGEGYHPNHSVNGLMNRLLFNGNNVEWDSNAFPPFSYPVYLATLISSIVFISLGLLWNYKSKAPGAVDLSIVMLCITMASPIAWEHHYGILLPIFILLIPFACYFYSYGRWKLAVFGLAFVIASEYLAVTKNLADSHLNILQSYLFFAAIVILAYSLQISGKIRKHGIDQHHAPAIDDSASHRPSRS